jgi:hypothetical protein
MAYSRGSGKNCTIVNCRNNYKKFCQMWANRSICSYSDFNLTRIMQSLYYAPAGHYIISIVPIEGAVLFELILTLLMWQNINTKQGTQKTQKKRSVWKPSTQFFTKFCTKELSSLRLLSSLHKATKSHIFMM